ncbi:unnamed protein product [Callosobruchus maculatus]|nr:unnamed protein product [Callosobruchus maculatus]
MEVNEEPLIAENETELSHVDNILNAKIDLDEDEKALLVKFKLERSHPIQFNEIHCTACNCHLGSALARLPNMFVHPLLKVLVCKACYEYYCSGDFERDEDGTEMYCRWCGQGGEVVCCGACPMVFCKTCIQINFDDDKLKEIKNNDDWKCFACDAEQIKHLKIQYFELAEYFQREMKIVGGARKNNILMKRDFSKCCADRGHDKTKKEKHSDEALMVARAEQLTKNINCLLKLPAPSSDVPVNGPPVLQAVNYTGKPVTVLFKRPMHNVNSATGFIRQGNLMTPVRLPPLPRLMPRYVAQAPYQQYTAMQSPLTPRTFVCKSTQVDYTTYDRLKGTLDKAVCSTALANCTAASSLLELSALTPNCHTVNDRIALYNTLQGSLSTYIKSLVEIKEQANNVFNTLGTVITDKKHVNNVVPAPTILPIVSNVRHNMNNFDIFK